jgi:hypothetical protein
MKEETENNAVPFFARYLEGQETPTVKTCGTLKYPSDSDEVGLILR